MSQPSNWPLPIGSFRLLLAKKIIEELSYHPLSCDLYPKAFGQYINAKKHNMLRRVHDDHLLIYCTDGSGSFRIKDIEYPLKTGDLLILPRGVAHAYQASELTPWTLYWCHFSGDKSSDFIQHLKIGKPSYTLPLGVNAKLMADFEILLEGLKTSTHLTSYIHAANVLRQILTYIAQLRPFNLKLKSAQQLDIEKVHTLMQASLHQTLDLETLAASVNLSKYHFIKKYKELTGTTPINHFIHLKIERACHLLDISNRSIKHISLTLGYEDAYYFSRIFKHVMGISPTEYRKIRISTFDH